MSLNVKQVAQEADYNNTNWRSKAFSFSGEGLNVSIFNNLMMRASGRTREVSVKIQLLDSLGLEIVNSSIGLYREKYLLKRSPETTEILIPLSEFKDLEIILTEIKRLTIHHGREAWGERLNDINTNQIIVEELEFR